MKIKKAICKFHYQVFARINLKISLMSVRHDAADLEKYHLGIYMCDIIDCATVLVISQCVGIGASVITRF